ncbi:hypothetical protein V1477_011902 [Vespula maculifrons]|uniref:Uncharacterized protein n=1 Tax=Vespula maculifrons TaxID=7453 RepID=A0ABD2C290_VESMC
MPSGFYSGEGYLENVLGFSLHRLTNNDDEDDDVFEDNSPTSNVLFPQESCIFDKTSVENTFRLFVSELLAPPRSPLDARSSRDITATLKVPSNVRLMSRQKAGKRASLYALIAWLLLVRNINRLARVIEGPTFAGM